MAVINLQVLSHFDLSWLKRRLPNGHSVAQSQHSDFTVFLTSRQM